MPALLSLSDEPQQSDKVMNLRAVWNVRGSLTVCLYLRALVPDLLHHSRAHSWRWSHQEEEEKHSYLREVEADTLSRQPSSFSLLLSSLELSDTQNL